MTQTFRRRRAMCATCPYRGGVARSEGWDAVVADVLRAGGVNEEPWPCHEDDPYGTEGVQCRGHAEGTRMLKRRLAEQAARP